MKTIYFINENLLQTLGITILHSIWQILLIGMMLRLLLWFLKNHSPELKFHLILAGMVTIFLASALTFYKLYEPVADSNTAMQQMSAIESNITTENNADNNQNVIASDPTIFTILQSKIQNNAHLITLFWLIGFLFFTIRFAGGYWYLARLRKDSIRVNQNIIDLSYKVKQKLNIRKTIEVLESAVIKIPIAMGYVKPVIILPLGLATSIPFNQLEAILIHEMAHIKRNDFLINLLKSVFEAIFFYHPVFWWISKQLENEREHCCDDITLAECNNNWEFPEALLNIELYNQKRQNIAPALYRNKFQLLNRIKRMKSKNNLNHVNPKPITGLLILPVFVLLFGLITAFAPGKNDLPNFNFNNDPSAPLQMGIGSMPDVRSQVDDTKANEGETIVNSPAVTPPASVPDTNEIKYGSKIKTEDGYVLMEFDEDMNLLNVTKNGKEVNGEEREKYEKFAAKSKKAFDAEKNQSEREKELQKLEEQLEEVKVKMAEVQAEYNQVLNSYLENIASTTESSWTMVQPEYFDAATAEVWQNMEDFHFDMEDFPVPEVPEVYFDEEELKAQMEEAKIRQEEAIKDFKYQYEQQMQEREMQELAIAHERDARAMEREVRELERQARTIEVGLQKELINDGLIDNWDDLHSLELSDQKFEINGDLQSKKMHKKYLDLYEELSGEKLNGRYQINND
ncbi:MAG TPA: M56 family metallopeptidase [Bacteroidales bacterium]|nr:M56 family metallopeptidase [Bacteroidales bacterium]HRX95346.1 M56 family metallopeptidase [Bacteroidales bacterium]